MNLVDSSCWLEYFAGSPRAALYAAEIEDLAHVLVSPINIYEVFKKLILVSDRTLALQTIGVMLRGHVVAVTDTIALDAAALSVEYRLPLADSILLATARAHGAQLITQDAHFREIPGVLYYPKEGTAA